MLEYKVIGRLILRKADSRKIGITVGKPIETVGIQTHGIEGGIVSSIEIEWNVDDTLKEVIISYENTSINHYIRGCYEDIEIVYVNEDELNFLIQEQENNVDYSNSNIIDNSNNYNNQVDDAFPIKINELNSK